MSEPFARKPPESTFPVGYQITDDGRRIDTGAEDEAKRARLTAAVLGAVGIVDLETKEEPT